MRKSLARRTSRKEIGLHTFHHKHFMPNEVTAPSCLRPGWDASRPRNEQSFPASMAPALGFDCVNLFL